MKPIAKVTVNGQPVAGAFYERLISLTVTQKEGLGTDTFDIRLNDGNPFLAIPPKGALVDIALGYGSASSLGQFVVDKVSVQCLPYEMKISGRSADLRTGKLKQRQERSWDKNTLSEIVSEIAAESGLSAAVDDTIGQFRYDWIAQNDESNINLLRRLEERHNGLFHIRDGRLIFAERGSGNAASGSFLGSVVVKPNIIIPNTCNFEMNDKPRHGKVTAYVQDRQKALREEIEEIADEGSDSVFRLPEPFASKEEAQAAAKSAAKELKREAGGGSVDLVGNAAVTAGVPLMMSGVRPGIDNVPYIIETATHTYSKTAGYRTKIAAKLFDGKSGSNGSGTAGSSASDDNAKVAENSAEGTPATPSQWFGSRRYASTDAN